MVSFALDRISGATKDLENGSILIGVKKHQRSQTALKSLQPCSVLSLDALAKTLFPLIGILQFACIVFFCLWCLFSVTHWGKNEGYIFPFRPTFSKLKNTKQPISSF